MNIQQIERLQQLHRLQRLKAMHDERLGKKIKYIEPPGSIKDAVEIVSDLRGADSVEASMAISRSKNPLLGLYDVAKTERDPQVLHFILANSSLEYFGSHYLPHHFFYEWKEGFHDIMLGHLRAAETHATNKPVVIMSFPETGKTTLCTVLLPIHAIAFPHHRVLPTGKIVDRRKRFILFISVVEDIAMGNLSTVLSELESNDTIVEDFGILYRDLKASRTVGGRAEQWNRRSATTTNGVHLEARSRGTKGQRSRKWRQYRPDLGIFTDIDDDQVRSLRARQNQFQWFTGTMLSRFDRANGNVIVEGNKAHEFSLINQLYNYGTVHGWNVVRFDAYQIDKETGEKTYTWPEQFGPEWEREKLDEMMGDTVAFSAEYLQQTSDSKTLNREHFKYYPHGEIDALLKRSAVFFALDPSGSIDDKGDFSAFAPIAYDPITGLTYVLPMLVEHMGLTEQAHVYTTLYRRYLPVRAGVESNGYQKILKPFLDEQVLKSGVFPHIEAISNTKFSKKERIKRLFDPIRNGHLLFLENDPTHAAVIDTLITMAHGIEPEHDDGPDALEMACRLKDEYYAVDFKKRGTASATIAVAKGGDSFINDPLKGLVNENEDEY